MVFSNIGHNVEQVKHVCPGWASIGAFSNRCDGIRKRLKRERTAVTGRQTLSGKIHLGDVVQLTMADVESQSCASHAFRWIPLIILQRALYA
jgi:hypothetical protein